MMGKKDELREKVKNAYLLIYERDSYFQMPTIKLLKEEQKVTKDFAGLKLKYEGAKVDGTTFSNVTVSSDLQQQLVQENIKYKMTKIVLNLNYIKFFDYLILNSTQSIINDYKLLDKYNLQLPLLADLPKEQQNANLEIYSVRQWKFFFIYSFTTLLRVTLKNHFPPILKTFKTVLKNNIVLCAWLLETFSNPNIILEFLIESASSPSRFFIASILKTAFCCLFKFEQVQFEKYCDLEANKSIIDENSQQQTIKLLDIQETTYTAIVFQPEKVILPLSLIFLNNLMALLKKAIESKNCLLQYSFLLTSIAQAEPVVANYFIHNRLVGIILEVILEAEQSELPKKRNLMIINKDLCLGFQKNAVTEKDKQQKSIVQIVGNMEKPYKFLIDMLATVHNFC